MTSTDPEFQTYLRHVKLLIEDAREQLTERQWESFRDILVRQLEARAGVRRRP